MKYLPLIWAGLGRKPTRTVLTFLSMATTFLLFGSLYGVSEGFDAVIERIPENRLHVTAVNLDRALPDHYKEKIEQVPGVASVMIGTEISAYYREPMNLLYIAALGGEAHLDVFGDITDAKKHAAALRQQRTAAVIGRTLAERFGWKLGDHVSLFTGPDLNQDGSDFMEFDIVGVYDVPSAPELARWFLLNYEYLEQKRVRGKGLTNSLYVDTVDTTRNDEVAAAIDRRFEGSEAATYTTQERNFQRAMIDSAIDMKLVVTSIISASLFALLMLATNTMMQSFRQRMPELAVLKTLGYGDSGIIAFTVAEAALLCVPAAVLGVAAATLLFPTLAKAVNAPVASLPLQVLFIAVLIGLLTALVSSALPAWRVRKMPVASILSGMH